MGRAKANMVKGCSSAGVSFTTDLHSHGAVHPGRYAEYLETVLSVEKSRHSLTIPLAADDADGLNYLAAGASAMSTIWRNWNVTAHVDGNVPNIRIQVPEISEHSLGQLIYFFELACGLSGYMLGVNPFDQPGVEAYKKKMFALLESPDIRRVLDDKYQAEVKRFD